MRGSSSLARQGSQRVSAPAERQAMESPDSQNSALPADFGANVARLRELYTGHPAAEPSMWSREYVASEIDLARFRADNAYVWQRFHGDDAYARSYRWLA